MVNLIDVRVTVPNLRNGAAEDITQAAPRASVPNAYKWAHIQGLSSSDYVKYVDSVIRAQYAQVLSGVDGAPSEADKTAARDTAIVLGATRAGAASAFQLVPADFNAAELAGTGSSFTPAAPAGGTPDAPTAAVEATIGTTAGTASRNHAAAEAMAPLTDREISVVNTVLYLGMAVPVMQGVSLTISGHHFLPTTKNTFLGMKRQAQQAGGQEVSSWIESKGDRFDDWAFHKACHPILPALKRAWAKSTDTAARLVASGHGAAAIRLPALPSDAQAGKASVAVFMKAAPVVHAMGHTIAYTEGRELLAAAERASEGREEREAVDKIRAWFVAHTSDIAFCAGIVQHLAETSGSGRESTLNAFSIKKAMSDGTASVTRGVTYCRAHLSRMRDAAERGEFADPNIRA